MSNESFAIPKNTKFAFVLESTEGTLASDAAANAVLVGGDGAAVRIPREFVERNLMHGSLSELPPIPGMWGDLGFTVTCELKGSGTQNTAPEIGDLLKCVLGAEHAGSNGTVAVSPTPTVTGWTITGGSFEAKKIIRQEVGSGFEYTRLLTESSGAVTVWPPVSAIMSGSEASQAGVSYSLLSTGFTTGSAYFYFDNGTKLTFAGCRGSAKFNFEVGKPVTVEFNMMALSPGFSHATQGYTPSVDVDTQPPTCLGMNFDRWYTGTVVTGSTTTSVIITATPDLEIAVGDILEVPISGTYEQATVTAVSGSYGSDKTCTVATLGGTPTTDGSVYVRRRTTLETGAGYTIDVGIEQALANCMNQSYGVSKSKNVKRSVAIEMNPYFKSMYEIDARDNAAKLQIFGVWGSTVGNIIACDVPNFQRTDVGIEFDELMMNPITGGAYYDSAGDDEFFLSLL